MMCQETYFSRRGIFPAYAFDQSFVDAHCVAAYGVAPRPGWVKASYYGATEAGALAFSRVLFSNGEFDPWRAAGVTLNDDASDIVSVLIPEVGPHLLAPLAPALFLVEGCG